MEKNNKLTTSTAEDTVTISRTEYENLLEDKRQKEWLLDQLRLARKKKFGASSEKVTEEVMEQLSFLFNEPAAYKQPPEAPERSFRKTRRSRKKRTSCLKRRAFVRSAAR